jgi:hypothetical protein
LTEKTLPKENATHWKEGKTPGKMCGVYKAREEKDNDLLQGF